MTGEATTALVAAAEAAGRAPSIHNTQPWRWVIRGDTLELHAERSRQLPELDATGHLLLLSCGAALHHARVALAAEGWNCQIDRPAGSPAGEPLAVVHLTGRGPVDPTAMRRFQTTLIRHTDRRPTSTDPVPPTALHALRQTVQAEGEQLHLLRPEQVLDLAAATHAAIHAEDTDERQREELAHWVGGTRPDGTGIPDTAIPHKPPQTTVPGRDFGITGTLPTDAGHDTAAVYAVLYGPGDTPTDWLHAGEALNAAWLDAIDHGLTLLPISAPIEIAHTAHLLHQLLAETGHPHLVIRLGTADPDHAGPRHTPRLPAEQTITVIDG